MSIKRDRCFHVLDKNGKDYIRIRAAKKPTGKSLKAFQELFEVAKKLIESK